MGGVALYHGEHTLGVDSLGRVARALQVFGRSLQVTCLHAGASGIEVGRLVLRIESHGGLHHVVELLGARLVGLRHHEHLLQGELLGLGLQHFLGFLHGERLHGVAHHVVRVAQGGIIGGEHEAVIRGILRLDALLLHVRVKTAVVYQLQDGLLVFQVAGRHRLAQSLPVLGGGGNGKLVAGQLHQVAHVFPQCLGAVFR